MQFYTLKGLFIIANQNARRAKILNIVGIVIGSVIIVAVISVSEYMVAKTNNAASSQSFRYNY